jgi:hypothetical protein
MTKLFVMLFAIGITGCKLAKPACQVIDLADSACHVFVLTDENGNKREVKMTGKEASEAMLLGQKVKAGSCK